MWRFLPTIIAGSIFIAAIIVEQYPYYVSGAVSPETVHLGLYRNETGLQQGVSADGMVSIAPVDIDVHVSQNMFLMNHSRTMRIFTAQDLSGSRSVLYIEQIKPHGTFMISGNYSVDPTGVSPRWLGEKKIIFSARDADGVLRRYVVDVSQPALISVPGI